jgi:hypothetical protein
MQYKQSETNFGLFMMIIHYSLIFCVITLAFFPDKCRLTRPVQESMVVLILQKSETFLMQVTLF